MSAWTSPQEVLRFDEDGTPLVPPKIRTMNDRPNPTAETAALTYVMSNADLARTIGTIIISQSEKYDAWHEGSWPGNPNPDTSRHITVALYKKDGVFETTNHVDETGHGTRNPRPKMWEQPSRLPRSRQPGGPPSSRLGLSRSRAPYSAGNTAAGSSNTPWANQGPTCFTSQSLFGARPSWLPGRQAPWSTPAPVPSTSQSPLAANEESDEDQEPPDKGLDSGMSSPPAPFLAGPAYVPPHSRKPKGLSQSPWSSLTNIPRGGPAPTPLPLQQGRAGFGQRARALAAQAPWNATVNGGNAPKETFSNSQTPWSRKPFA